MYTLLELESKTFGELKKIGYELNVLPADDRRRRQSWIDALVNINPPLLQLLEVSPAVEVDRVQEPIIETVETSPGVELEQAQEAIEKVAKTSPAAFVEQVKEAIELQAQEPISQVAKTSPGVEVDRAQDAIEQVPDNTPDVDPNEGPECFECFDDKFVEDGGFIKPCPRCSEPNLSHQRTQRAIAPAAKNRIEEEPDQNPILTGIALSDRFLARYAPPRSEFLYYEIPDGYKADTDGQLSLLEAHVVTEPEPPDPDDFESLDAFREAIARWDAQNPEPPAVSIDSMCEWAPCPQEWYEPEAEILPLKASSMIELPEQSEVMELPPPIETSSTSDFFIPTFGRWGDRSNRSDEPPDTGFFARLPKPKPPKFPPQAASWTQVGRKLDTSWTQVTQASRNYPETIPKLFHRVAAGSSTQPARSPPGGDAMF